MHQSFRGLRSVIKLHFVNDKHLRKMQVILVILDDSSNLENAGQIINHVNLRFEQIVVIAALSGLQIY